MYGALGALRPLGWSLATPILRCSQGLQSAIGILLLCLAWTADIVSNYPSYVEMQGWVIWGRGSCQLGSPVLDHPSDKQDVWTVLSLYSLPQCLSAFSEALIVCTLCVVINFLKNPLNLIVALGQPGRQQINSRLPPHGAMGEVK